MKKVTLLTSIGTAIEYYDFLIFILFAAYISQVFFPPGNENLATIETLLIFAIGYFFRPLGGFILGTLGDKYGRKNVFLASISMMAIGTLGIGLLPTFEQIGYFAIALLCVLRALQGFSQGAELPGAITFISEHAHSNNRGFHVTMMFMAVSIGSLFCTLTHYLLTTHLNEQQLLDWGWRIPFLIGGIILVIGFYLRRNTFETPIFTHASVKQKKVPASTIFKAYKRRILLGISITITAASFVVFGVYSPAFAAEHFGYDASSSYLALSQIIFLSLFSYPLMGLLSEKIGRKNLLILLSLLVIILFPIALTLLNNQSQFALYFFLTLVWMIPSCFISAFPTMLAELFPTSVRYTGVALCYNCSYALAALTPATTVLIVNYTEQPQSIGYLFVSLAIITFTAACFTKDRRGISLEAIS